MRKLTQEDYIKSCIDKHGDIYDYSLVEYVNIRSKILIICREHGVFEQCSKGHKDGHGCPKCYANKNLTKSEFIELYGKDNYDYSLINDVIIKSKDYINIINKKNGLIYTQLSANHRKGIIPMRILSTSLVEKLSIIHDNNYDYIVEKDTYYITDKIKMYNKTTGELKDYRIDKHLKGKKSNRVSLEYFLYKSNDIHNGNYDYSLIKELNSNLDKVDIICKEHGVFNQIVNNHMNCGTGCPKCVGRGKWNNETLTIEFNKVHFDLYDYSKVYYKGVDNKVDIICRKHGIFQQNIHKHLIGQGCPDCKYNSKGEEYIKNYLERNEIKYIRQKGFDDCRYINRLSFDFYLPDMNICLEYDGIHHFKPIKDFGGEKEFKLILKRDECKNKWCYLNNVKLIRIRYDEFNRISEILDEKLQIFVNKK